MKTPEEIKKGLECCSKTDKCPECPYYGEDWCSTKKNVDALAYIQRLEIRNGAIEKSLDEVFVLNDKQASIIRSLNSNNSQVRKALQDNGFRTLEELLQAYSQVKRERDAAVSELPHHCWNCKYHRDEPIEEIDDYGRTIHIYCDADCCFPDENSSWEWRGVQEPPKED